MTTTLISTDIDNDRCPKCGAPMAGDIVRITRAQYEALMAAAKSLAAFRNRHPAIMAVRATGIQIEGE